MTLLERLVAALLVRSLVLFPPAYRREYSDERVRVFRLAVADAATKGWPALLRFAARELRDLPLALFREHWKERRQAMSVDHEATPPLEERTTGRRLLWFTIPFLALLLLPLEGLSNGRLWHIPALLILLLLLFTIVLAVTGLVRGMPQWALPALGLLLGFANLMLLMMMPLFGIGRLKAVLWTDFMPSRVLYAVIADSLMLMPVVLLLLLLVILLPAGPGRFSLRERIAQDGTLLPFFLYTTNLVSPFMYDVYQGLEPYRFLFVLSLLAGAWLYLRASQPTVRLVILLAATLLAGAVLALGIYLIFPQQSFSGGFPRWWETLNPLLDAVVRVVALYLLAMFSAALRSRKQYLNTAPLPKA